MHGQAWACQLSQCVRMARMVGVRVVHPVCMHACHAPLDLQRSTSFHLACSPGTDRAALRPAGCGVIAVVSSVSAQVAAELIAAAKAQLAGYPTERVAPLLGLADYIGARSN